MSIKDIGEKLTEAGRLKSRPLCIYGSETVPEGGVLITSVDKCLVKAIFKASQCGDMPPLYFGKGAVAGCCPGGIGWTGYGRIGPQLEFFVSTGSPTFRNGEAEYLKASPEIVRRSKEGVGEIAPPGTYIVVRPCADLDSDPGVRSFLCFGNSEQIRNMSSLVHFGSTDPFNPVLAAWGPTCASWITYPAGMAEKAPRGSAYLGPMDPTGNNWFPEGLMSIGIPADLARSMCEDLDSSFIVRRPHVAYPGSREDVCKLP
ncbi:DUF169 domain-containing protein [Methanomassiliicoccus luminyensis]|nr:DUF169 domain-containing protein [Methanomassiliicoccus luminyensis]